MKTTDVLGMSLIAALVLTACSAELSDAGKSVRQISLDTAGSCKFLGPVTASESMGMDEAMDVASSFNKARNSVAMLGGNAFIISSTNTSMMSTVVQIDAYRC